MSFEEKLNQIVTDIKVWRLTRKCYEALKHLEKWDQLCREVQLEVKAMTEKKAWYPKHRFIDELGMYDEREQEKLGEEAMT